MAWDKPIPKIYIPIWLDLLLAQVIMDNKLKQYLHSNMVRFIIDIHSMSRPTMYIFTFQYG